MTKHSEIKRRILQSLIDADPPLTSQDLRILTPDINERTLRRWSVKLQEQGLIEQEKIARGYAKGVGYNIKKIDRVSLRKLLEHDGVAAD